MSDRIKITEKLLQVFKSQVKSPGHGPETKKLSPETDKVKSPEHGSATKTSSPGTNRAGETFNKYKIYDSDDDCLLPGHEMKRMVRGRSDFSPSPRKKEKHQKRSKSHHSRRVGTVQETAQSPNTLSKSRCSLHCNSHHHAKECHQSKEHHHYKERHESKESYLSFVRERRRKSKSQRNKRRDKRNETSKQVDPKVRSDFRNHVRKAQEITSKSKVDQHNSEEKAFAVITQSRLTRRLGIFNQGKKSNKILRDGIIVPEAVQSKTEVGLKRILAVSNSKNKSPSSLQRSMPDHPVVSPSCAIRNSPVITPTQPPLQSCHLHRTPPSSWVADGAKSKRNKNVGGRHLRSSSGTPSSHGSGTPDLLKSPSLREISHELQNSLQVYKFFPGKEDYLTKVYLDLKKMMELYSSSPSDVAVQPSTPTKSTTCISSKSSNPSVCRTLEDSFSKSEDSQLTSRGDSSSIRVQTDGCDESSIALPGTDIHQSPRPDDRPPVEADEPNNNEKVIQPTTEETEHHNVTKVQNKIHEPVLDNSQNSYDKTVTTRRYNNEELINDMMDGLKFLKNAAEVEKIWSTTESHTDSQNTNLINRSNKVYCSDSQCLHVEASSKDTGPSGSITRSQEQNIEPSIDGEIKVEVRNVRNYYPDEVPNASRKTTFTSHEHMPMERTSYKPPLSQREIEMLYDVPTIDDIENEFLSQDIFDYPTTASRRRSCTFSPLSPCNYRRDVPHLLKDYYYKSPKLRKRKAYLNFSKFKLTSSSDSDDYMSHWYSQLQHEAPMIKDTGPPKLYPQKMF